MEGEGTEGEGFGGHVREELELEVGGVSGLGLEMFQGGYCGELEGGGGRGDFFEELVLFFGGLGLVVFGNFIRGYQFVPALRKKPGVAV